MVQRAAAALQRPRTEPNPAVVTKRTLAHKAATIVSRFDDVTALPPLAPPTIDQRALRSE